MLEDLLVDTVNILSLVVPVGQDAGGGQEPQYTTTATGVRCNVQPDDFDRSVKHDKNTSEVTVIVFFRKDPGVHVRDQLEWVTADGVSKAYVDSQGATRYPIITLDGRTTVSPRQTGPLEVTGKIIPLR